MIVEVDSGFIHAGYPFAGQAGDFFLYHVSTDYPVDPGIVSGEQCGARFHEGYPDGSEAIPPPRMHGKGQFNPGGSTARNDDAKGMSICAVVRLKLVNTAQQLAEGPRGKGVFPDTGRIHPPGNRTDVDRKGIVGERRPAVPEVDLPDFWIDPGDPGPDEPDPRPRAQRPQFHFHFVRAV